jgi:ADP-ribose pyrophosphatase
MMPKPRKVEIVDTQEVFKHSFFSIESTQLRHEKYDGTMSSEMTCISFERGDAVAALMHFPLDDTIVLIEQFRYPAHKKSDGWLIELPAGVIEPHELPAQTMRREIEEETGYRVEILYPIHTFFTSPGASSERIFLFYGRIDPHERINEGGGAAHTHEDIKTMHITIDQALWMMKNGEIVDAKTIIALQWLEVNRERLSVLKDMGKQ